MTVIAHDGSAPSPVLKRIVVYGAGAVGGVLGARLALAGHDVVLIARGQHLDAMRHRGLRIETPHDAETVRLPVAATPADAGIGPDDVVVLAMKSNDTLSALSELRAVAGPATPVVCMQNGVANERTALRRFENVYGVWVMLPAAFLAPGVVQNMAASTPGLLDIGRFPSGTDQTAARIAATFREAGFDVEARPDIMRWKYRKLIMNLANAVLAMFDSDGDTAPVLERVRAEGAACLQAARIDVASEQDVLARSAGLRMQPVDGRTTMRGSSWQSLARSTGSIEADYLNGEVVLLGRLYGVPAPVNAQVQRMANEFAAAGRQPGSGTKAELAQLLALPNPPA